MTTKRKTALAELEQRREKLREAEQNVADREAESAQANRALERALGPLRDYDAAVAAGEREEDPEEEARLHTAVANAQATVTWQTVQRDGQRYSVPREERAWARLEGSRRALTKAQGELEGFVFSNFTDIAAELAVRAREATDELDELWEQVEEARLKWTTVAREWYALARLDGTPVEMHDMPDNPLRLLDLRDGFPLPMPFPLLTEDEQEKEQGRPYYEVEDETNRVDGSQLPTEPSGAGNAPPMTLGRPGHRPGD